MIEFTISCLDGGHYRMNKSRRCVVLVLAMLFAVAALTCAGSAVFDKTALSGGLFQLQRRPYGHNGVARRQRVYRLDQRHVFCRGQNGRRRDLSVTDAALAEPDRIYAELGDKLLEYLETAASLLKRPSFPRTPSSLRRFIMSSITAQTSRLPPCRRARRISFVPDPFRRVL